MTTMVFCRRKGLLLWGLACMHALTVASCTPIGFQGCAAVCLEGACADSISKAPRSTVGANNSHLLGAQLGWPDMRLPVLQSWPDPMFKP